MSYPKSPLRGSCRSAIALLALLVHLPARAETPDASQPDLKPLIVSALQVPRDPAVVTSAVTALDPGDLEARGLFQLRDAINEVPGVISTSTSGQLGAPGSLFIRGTTTQYAQVVVDGMRLSDSNNQLGHILSAGHSYDVGGIEVLRGPQGAIYGGESVGGVLWLETPHGSGSPRQSATMEAGSFDSFATYGMAQGESGPLSYYLSGGYQTTANDAPHNHFEQQNTALRLEGKINPAWTIGTTFRASGSYGQDLDSPGTNHSESRIDSDMATIYATGRISDCWTARFHAGYYQESYHNTSISTWGPVPAPAAYFNELQAGGVSTDHEIKLGDKLRLLAGAFYQQDSYQSTISPDQSGTRYGFHSTLEWDVIEHLTATASLRWEDYDTFGDKTTWRLGSIYTLAATGTTLRGGVGTSFRAPTYMEMFGSAYGPGNPGLQPESSLGWDIGIEQKIGEHHTLEATWFNNRITDQIVYPPVGPPTWASLPPHNVAGDSTTDGLEIGQRGDCANHTIGYRVAWTYLHESLQNAGLPRNAATASLDWKPTPRVLLGIGASHLSDRSWGGNPLDSYTVARIYGSYQLTDSVKLHARLENVFDSNYQLFNGYGSVVNGAGTGCYAGVTVAW